MSATAVDEVGFKPRRLVGLPEPVRLVYRSCTREKEPVYTGRYNPARVGEVLARYGVYTGGLPQWSQR